MQASQHGEASVEVPPPTWARSQKGEEAVFGETWTGPLSHQDREAVVIFPPVDLQLGFISPASHPLQRPMSLRTWEGRPLSGLFPPRGHQVPGKRT